MSGQTLLPYGAQGSWGSNFPTSIIRYHRLLFLGVFPWPLVGAWEANFFTPTFILARSTPAHPHLLLCPARPRTRRRAPSRRCRPRRPPLPLRGAPSRTSCPHAAAGRTTTPPGTGTPRAAPLPRRRRRGRRRPQPCGCSERRRRPRRPRGAGGRRPRTTRSPCPPRSARA